MAEILTSPAKEKVRSFTDLIAWQEGHKLLLMIYAIVEKFPSNEKFELSGQLRSAAVSVTSNIAEGFRRNTAKDKRNFYTMSLGSITEIQNQLIIARDLGFINQTTFESTHRQSGFVSKLVQGLIRTAKTRPAK